MTQALLQEWRNSCACGCDACVSLIEALGLDAPCDSCGHPKAHHHEDERGNVVCRSNAECSCMRPIGSRKEILQEVAMRALATGPTITLTLDEIRALHAHETTRSPEAIVRAVQLDRLATYLQSHQFDAMAESARESAKLLRDFAGVSQQETNPSVWPRLEFGPFCGCCTRNKITLGLPPDTQYSPAQLPAKAGEAQRTDQGDSGAVMSGDTIHPPCVFRSGCNQPQKCIAQQYCNGPLHSRAT